MLLNYSEQHFSSLSFANFVYLKNTAKSMNPTKIQRRRVVHMSHTNIASDSRILKELASLSTVLSCSLEVYGFGIKCNSLGHPRFVPENISLFKLRSRKLPACKLRSILAFFELNFYFFASAFKYKPYIVHCHDLSPLLAATLLKFIHGTKIILDAHELESFKNGLSNLAQTVSRLFEAVLLPFTDSIITVSNSISAYYKHRFAKPVFVVLNRPSVPLLAESRGANIKDSTIHKLYSLEQTAKVIIYIGLLSPGRGLERLIYAFKDSAYHILFLGEGVLFDRLNVLASESTNIHFHQFVPHQEVVNIAKSCFMSWCVIDDCSLSDYFSLPNKLWESLSAGVPVIASDFPEIKAVVCGYKAGILVSEADTPQDIFQKVNQFSNRSINFPVINPKDLSWSNDELELIRCYQYLLGFPN